MESCESMSWPDAVALLGAMALVFGTFWLFMRK